MPNYPIQFTDEYGSEHEFGVDRIIEAVTVNLEGREPLTQITVEHPAGSEGCKYFRIKETRGEFVSRWRIVAGGGYVRPEL
jgi:hypothetical protein